MGKYTIADPSGFKQKLKLMKKKERAEKLLNRSNSKRSEFTEVTGDGVSNSKFSASGMGTSDGNSSKGNVSDRDSDREGKEKDEADEDAHNEDDTNKSNQVLPMMNSIFSDIEKSISTRGKEKLNELKKMHMIDEVEHEDEWEDKVNMTPLDELVNDMTNDQ